MKVNKWFGLVCIAAIMSSCAVSSDEKKENNGYENDVIKTIMERRSIRKYQDKPVSRDILQTLVECGVNAPNAVNRQQWQVRVVDNASYIDGISAVYKAANPKVEQEPLDENILHEVGTSHIRKSSHGVKGLLHTIITNTDSLWQTHHFAGLTLRSSAYVAYIFVFIIFIFIVVLFCHTVHSCPFYCSTAQSALHFLTHSLHYAKISAVCSHS